MFEGFLAPIFFVIIVAVVLGVALYRRRQGRRAQPRGGARVEVDAQRARGVISSEDWKRRRTGM